MARTAALTLALLGAACRSIPPAAHAPRAMFPDARSPRRPLVAAALLLALACDGASGDAATSSLPLPIQHARPIAQVAPEAFVASAEQLGSRLRRLGSKSPGVPRVLFLGDSFTSGFGLLGGEPPWPELLARELTEEQVSIEVVNAGLVGDTSLGGRRRLPDLAHLQPDVLVIELGGNDCLAGLSIAGVRENLREIVVAGRAMGARVLLSGLSLPPAMLATQRGRDFVAVYPELAAELDVALVPDLLEDVVDGPRFLQADGLHPNAEGHAVMARNALAPLRALLAATDP